jgi:2-polyprenyl-3-methyl-5-hydroxy-6-metoxy-1,4-benzoquinol methylase
MHAMSSSSTSAALGYDNVGGNFYDKYNTRNPIARYLVDGFLKAFDELASMSNAKTAYEVGCGEGMLSLRLLAKGLRVHGSDVDPDIVEEANRQAEESDYGKPFTLRNLYDLDESEGAAQLVVCCEVLEHIPDPAAALDRLARLARPCLLLSVPREPLWRILNMARGKYLLALGNTPGHINHWSSRQFLELLAERFEIIAVHQPLPWTMALCRQREPS